MCVLKIGFVKIYYSLEQLVYLITDVSSTLAVFVLGCSVRFIIYRGVYERKSNGYSHHFIIIYLRSVSVRYSRYSSGLIGSEP